MKTQIVKESILSICTFILYSLLSVNIQAQPDNDQIVYLNLKLVDGRVNLQDFSVVKGKLKRPRQISPGKDPIHYSVVDQHHSTVFAGALSDPTRMVYEYEDEHGQLQTKVVVSDSVNFFVRIPYDPDIQQINFYKIDKWTFWGLTLMKRKQNIGSITLDLSAGKNEE